MRSVKLSVGTILLAYCSMASSAAHTPKTFLQCSITYTSSFQNPWLRHSNIVNLDVDYADQKIIDKTVNEIYHQFDIIKNDSSWLVARSTRTSLIKDYLQFEDSHRPKYAELSINKINLSIELTIDTEEHTDSNDAYVNFAHVGSVVYVGQCNVVRRKI